MEEDLSLSLELGGCFTKKKREMLSEEKTIVNERESQKITETKNNSKESLIMHLSLHSVHSETKKESFRNQFSQSKVQENSDESLALSVTSQHSMELSQQEKQSIRYKTNIDDSCVATVSDIAAMNEEENSHARKKLRLSREQALLLEENFRKHTTINPKLKVMLAKQLTLQPRQVEVWFQNRRARTKLKQTEIECKYLKQRYQMLIQEHIQLKSEVAELRALSTACANASYPFYKHIGVIGALPLCPSSVYKPTDFASTKSLFPKTRF